MSRSRPGQGDIVGPYRLGALIGQGGMGVVHRAEDTDGRVVALKTVLTDQILHVASIRVEIGTLAQIRHPGVVRVFDHGLHEGTPWYAMELLEGRTLHDLLGEPVERRSPLPLADALRLVRRICDPLAFLHGEGIVHRDLKPSNVFLKGDDDAPVLVDFGLVRRFGGRGQREKFVDGETALAGTLLYVSPEQLAGGVLDPRADIYALGCLLYELIVGQAPFQGNAMQLTLKHLKEAPPRASDRIDGLPPEVDELITAMIRKRPADRIGYAVDVATAIDDIASRADLDLRVPAALPTPRDYLYRSGIAGRHTELLHLQVALRDDEYPLILVRGPSGIGKTRLATELAQRMRLGGNTVVQGACEPLSGTRQGWGGEPLHGFRGVLRGLGDHCRARGPEETRRIFGPRGAVLAIFEPTLEDLVEPSTRAPWLPTTEASRRRLETWLAETLCEFASGRGLTVFIDDIQWADEVSLAFLRAVADRLVPTLGVHFVCTCRDGSSVLDELSGRRGVAEIEVGRLDQEASASLVCDALGHAAISRPLVDRLAGAKGNPLHLTEYLHAAVARGFLRRGARGWEFSDDAGALEMPSTIEELIALRVESHGPAARELLELIATFGRAVDTDLLIEASDLEEHDVLACGGELLSHDVLALSGFGALALGHATLRETIDRDVEPSQRRALHRRVALALESVPDAPAGELAAHWDRAGEAARAIPAYLAAGMAAQRMTASARAKALFERGFALERELRLTVDDGFQRRQLEIAYGQALYGASQLAAAEDALRSALARLLGAPFPRSRRGWVGHALGELLGHMDAPRRTTMGERETALALQGLEALTSILMARADTLGQVGTALTGGNLAARSDPGDAASVGFARMALLTGLAGLEGLADSYMVRARAATAGSGLPPRAHSAEALVCLARARWDRLDALHGPALRACQEAGDFQAEVQIRLFAVGAAIVRGRPADCIAKVGYALPLTERQDYALERTHLLGNLAAAWVLAGDAGRARDAVEDHSSALGGGGDPVARTLNRVLDAATVLLEDSTAARSAADSAHAALRRVPLGSPGYLVHYIFLPAVYLGLAERGDREALSIAKRLTRSLARQARGQPAAAPIAKLYSGIQARMAGRRRRARRLLEDAACASEKLQLDWAHGVAHHELSRMGDASSFERAQAIFAEIGARATPFYALA